MEEMAKLQSSSSDSSYASIPFSPRSKSSCSFNSNPIHFYSEPTSPTRTSASDFPFLWELEKEQLIKTSPPGHNSDENFEFKTNTTHNFDTSSNSRQHQPGLVNQKTEQVISFADQLFHNGKILPLKPPPRFQYIDGNAKSASEKSALKSSFTCWSFNRNDFDPFMAALEHVKKEERWKKNYQGSPPKNHPRRSRSLSPMRTTSPSHWANSNDHSSTAWNTKKHINRRHLNSTPTRPTDPEISASTRPVNERPINKPTTLVVFPGRTVKLVSVQKRCKKVNIFKEFVLLRMECLGGKGRL
ncbi:Protein of unknown function DUF1645 [Macleaya cordata]|uniref:Uncharacterized protein n=1 Tax=Macleaya cordata TaxID=56857 RepID=A0A200PUW1_MACCD|nr:Protein of unknown function DUF1645 [Macleaya cordata]